MVGFGYILKVELTGFACGLDEGFEGKKDFGLRNQKDGRLVFGALVGLGSQVFFSQMKQLGPSHRGRRK